MSDRWYSPVARVGLAALVVAGVVSCGGDNAQGPTFDFIDVRIEIPEDVDTVAVGAGTGTVMGSPNPVDIDCQIAAGVSSGTCTYDFNDAGLGGVIVISAAAANGSIFERWAYSRCAAEVAGACDIVCGANGIESDCTLTFDDQSGDVTFWMYPRFSLVSPPQPTVVEGTAYDTAASPLPGVWSSVTFIDVEVSTDTTDAAGFFRHDVETGGAYAMLSRGQTGLMAFVTLDSADVASGDTATVDPMAREGHAVAFSAGVGDLAAAGGAEVPLPDLDWQVWSRTGCPGCTHHVVVGIDGEPGVAFRIETPGLYPGVSGTETLSVTAPAVPGAYGVYATRYATGELEALELYAERWNSPDFRAAEFIQLGTLTVE